jgi:hypothetical protein
MGYRMEGVRTALNVDEGLRLLDTKPAARNMLG